MASVMSRLKNMMKTQTPPIENESMSIGSPTNFQPIIHVSFDPDANEFHGLPHAWKHWLEMSSIR